MAQYLDILAGTFMVRQLPPWFENLKKRQVKAPKVYLRDSGLVHTLLGLETHEQILAHPKCGASWEGFALEQVLQRTGVEEPYFWGTHGNAELDLLIFKEGRRFGIEFKRSETPKVTRSMRTAIDDLGLEHLWIVYPGSHVYPLDERITVSALGEIPATTDGLAGARGGAP